MCCYVRDMCVFFFFFKQKTAYEMRISDWSSDVCSSDLLVDRICHSSLMIADFRNGTFGENLTIWSCHFTARFGAASISGAKALVRTPNVTRHDYVSGRPDTVHWISIDRKRGVLGKSVSVRVELGGRRLIKKKNKHTHTRQQ